MVIRESIEASDQAIAEASAVGDDSQELNADKYRFGQVYLGSRQSKGGGVTIGMMEAANWRDKHDPAFKDFRLHLNRSLSIFVNDLKASDINNDGNWKAVRLTEADKVRQLY